MTEMPKKRLAIIVDAGSLKRWQHDALRAVADDHDIYHLVVENERTPKRRLPKHAGYYALNALALKNAKTRKLGLQADNLDPSKTLRFTPDYEGAWASFPAEVGEWLEANRIDAVIKFAMSLVRIPDGFPPILSYHHGNPDHYRGRPAGFYELLNGEHFVGQIVQILSNELDAGEVLAFGETQVKPQSYRATMVAAYSLSPYLLPKALDNLFSGERIAMKSDGRNYRLPSNMQVARAGFAMVRATVSRLVYGAFFEKRWQVSTLPDAVGSADIEGDLDRISSARSDWRDVPQVDGYTFLADPFYAGDGSMLVEGLNARTGKGEILRIDAEGGRPLSVKDGTHLSYPAVYERDGRTICIPEMAQAASCRVYEFQAERMVESGSIDAGTGGIIDPTFHRSGGKEYLFGNLAADDARVLRLWIADGLDDTFVEHPASPIRLSCRGARMGGLIAEIDGTAYRFGQDCKTAYGDALLVFRIDALTPTEYAETFIGRLAFDGVKGPHTLNLRGKEALFDWYEEKFSLLAGVRRLRARLG